MSNVIVEQPAHVEFRFANLSLESTIRLSNFVLNPYVGTPFCPECRDLPGLALEVTGYGRYELDGWEEDKESAIRKYYDCAVALRLLLSFARNGHVPIMDSMVSTETPSDLFPPGTGTADQVLGAPLRSEVLFSSHDELQRFLRASYPQLTKGTRAEETGISAALQILESASCEVIVEIAFAQTWMSLEVLAFRFDDQSEVSNTAIHHQCFGLEVDLRRDPGRRDSTMGRHDRGPRSGPWWSDTPRSAHGSPGAHCGR